MRFAWRDVVAVGGMIAGLGGSSSLTAFGDSLDAIAPGYGRKTVALISVVAFALGLVLRTNTSNTNAAIAATTTGGLHEHG